MRSYVRIGKPEALDLLRKWSSERTLLRCDAAFMMVRFSLSGRISSLSDDILMLRSEDDKSEFSLRIYDEWTFEYGDTRNMESAKTYDSILVLRPNGIENGPRIGFAEVKDGKRE